ncbi:MAG: tetratricopeptide repeat protein [Gallionella sp.]
MKSGKPIPKQLPTPSPGDIEALLALFNARHYTDAESRTRALLEKYPGFAFGWKLLGGALQRQGKDALPAFQRVAKLMPDDAEAHYNLGIVLKSAGQLNNAAASYRRAIALKPDYAEAHSNLGNTLTDLGQPKDAVISYRRALKLNPDSADAHNNLGTALKDIGQLKDAIASYQQAVALKPDFVLAYYNLGNALKELGQLDEAMHNYRRAIVLKPDFAEAHNNLGGVLKELGQFTDALASYRRVLELKPDFAEAHYNLGNTLKELGQPEDAVTSYRRAIQINPDLAEAHSNLGNALKELGQFDNAVSSCRRAIEIKPDFADAYNNLGIALKELGKFEAASASYCRAIEIKPNFPEAHNNLGNVLKELGQFDEAVKSYRRAIEIKPDYAEAHSNLGIVFKDIGQHDAALVCYRRALELKPDYVEAQTNLLFTLNYTAQAPDICFTEAQAYGRMVDQKVTTRFSTWPCAEKPERLRVGMISGDLHNHPVGYFLESLLAQLDPVRIELIAYPTDNHIDALTTRIQPHFIKWKSLHGLSDADAARLIHADGVHVLLDLSGHTGKNRLPIFAWKPAPVQASWLGYFATTGVAEMDYLLADETGVPEAHRKDFSETLWYLPDTRLCFSAPEFDLPIAPLPARQNGYLTFGCFQNLPKVGNEVLTVWSKILNALPDARLRWQCKQLADPTVAAQLAERLQQHGIAPARVSLHGTMSREAYLAAHAKVDLILDTFPFPGGTTTCEGLWMGIPTLTLAGDTLLARQGASMLTAAGLPDWVATSTTEYIAQAIARASDLPTLATLRAGLRQQVSASPLFDAKRFARNFEEALWGMWQTKSLPP